MLSNLITAIISTAVIIVGWEIAHRLTGLAATRGREGDGVANLQAATEAAFGQSR